MEECVPTGFRGEHRRNPARVPALVLVGFLSFLCGGVLKAEGLKWEQTTVSLAASPTDKKIETEFAFTNTSATAVSIRKVSTSCGCTTAVPSQKVYQPGESGRLKVVFNFGGRKGAQAKGIVVQTDGGKDVLRLQVDIADPVRVDREMLSWKAGDPLEAQVFEVTVREPESARITAVKSLSDAFVAELEEVEAGRKYRVVVKPLKTDRPQKGTIRLEVVDPSSRAIYLRAEVKS